MKKSILAALLAIIFIAGCEKDPIPNEKPVEPPKYTPATRVEGRVALAYVTSYGTAIPDPTFFTHFNYAFAEIYMVNGEYKGFKLQGSEFRFQQIVNLKSQYPNLKISISFINSVSNADNIQGGGFSALSKSDEYRKAFASDCKAFLIKWGIDGIDMDWEFPGMSWGADAFDAAVDVQNHVLLMKQLRETLGAGYLLTYAGYVTDKKIAAGGYKYIDVKAVDPYVDFVNLMTYDISDAPKHHSALFNANADWDCDRTVKAYLNAGVAANKLVLGIPFYGRISFSKSPGAITYRNIMQLDRSIYKIDNWDQAASVPFVTKNGLYYCGYDNERSIAAKGAWLLGLGMKGLMCWQYDQDDVSGTLRKALWEATMKK